MAEPVLDAAAVVARARAAEGPDGRLALPDVAGWDVFPFEGDLRVKHLEGPVLPESPRRGEEGPAHCFICARGDDGYAWAGERWRLTLPREPVGVPTLLLEPREHVDLAGLDDTMAAALGLLVVRLTRALEAMPGVGRVHVDRCGDGQAHLHVWFTARPAGLRQLGAPCLPLWLDILPPMPRDELEAFARHVAAALGDLPFA